MTCLTGTTDQPPRLPGPTAAPCRQRRWRQGAPSQLPRKRAAYSPQNHLALALREVGRVERTLFMLRWIADAALQHRVQLGLNKGEAHHAFKRAIALGRRGPDR